MPISPLLEKATCFSRIKKFKLRIWSGLIEIEVDRQINTHACIELKIPNFFIVLSIEHLQSFIIVKQHLFAGNRVESGPYTVQKYAAQ